MSDHDNYLNLRGYVFDPINEVIKPKWTRFLCEQEEGKTVPQVWDELYEVIKPYEAKNFLVHFPNSNIFEAFEGSIFEGSHCVVKIAMKASNTDAGNKILKQMGVDTSHVPKWFSKPHLEIEVIPAESSTLHDMVIKDRIVFCFDPAKHLHDTNFLRRVFVAGESYPGLNPDIDGDFAISLLTFLNTHIMECGRALKLHEVGDIERSGCHHR